MRGNVEFWIPAYTPTPHWAIQHWKPVERSTVNAIPPQLILSVCPVINHLFRAIDVFRRNQTPSLPWAIRVRVDHNTAPRTARYVANARFIALFPNYYLSEFYGVLKLLATHRTAPTKGQIAEDQKWVTAMRKARRHRSKSWWENARDPPSWPNDADIKPVKQAGTRGGHYWPPSADQISWEKPSSPDTAAPPPPTSKRKTAPADPQPRKRMVAIDAEAGAPTAPVPLGTPPRSPEPAEPEPRYLLTLEPLVLGNTSPGKVCAPRTHIPMSRGKYSHATQEVWW